MKAIRVHEFGSPEVMHLEDVPDLHPGADQVLVSIKAAGVNPADTYVRTGTYALKPSLPYTPGMEGAGLVEETGENVKGLARGKRVYLSGSVTGTYAEQTLCTIEHVHPLPDHLSFSQGAAVSVAYTTAYRALFQRGHALPGETVLVHGATGGVGIAAVQLSKAAGMLVIGSGGSERGRKLLLDEGANFVIDHRSPGHLDQVLTLTNGQGADVILEMLANVNLGLDLKALAKGGRVLIVGSRGRVEVDPRDLMSREAAVLGVYIMSKDEKKSAHCAIGAGLANKSLHPIVGKEIPLREAPRAHHEVMQPGAYGKIVLVP
ncbi:MAG TPA: NADPH:quinone reductase [Candidatus Bathyarchaeia archaeon]|nr:NADPH:quinone reductase [Candidatus Bathyarchaeia archaeon]